MINHLKDLEINTIYNFDNSFSINELLCKFWEKLEETINISNESIDILNWIKEQGLTEEVQTLINQLVGDGTIEQMINVKKIEELRTLINANVEELRTLINANVVEINNKITDVMEQMDTIQQKIEELRTLINANEVEINNNVSYEDSISGSVTNQK